MEFPETVVSPSGRKVVENSCSHTKLSMGLDSEVDVVCKKNGV